DTGEGGLELSLHRLICARAVRGADLRRHREEVRNLMAERDMEVKMLATATINTRALSRDRIIMDADAMEELKASIGSNGVRMPIEVFALEEPRGDKVWGLISGYRRLYALRE